MIPTVIFLSILSIILGLFGLVAVSIELHQSYRSRSQSRQSQNETPWPASPPSIELPPYPDQTDCNSVEVSRPAHIVPPHPDAEESTLVHRPKSPLPLPPYHPPDQPFDAADKQTGTGAKGWNWTEWVHLHRLFRGVFRSKQEKFRDLEQGRRAGTRWAETRERVPECQTGGDEGNEARGGRRNSEGGWVGSSNWIFADLDAEWDRQILEESRSRSGRRSV